MIPIRRVSVLSTGSVQIRPQHVESNGTPLVWWLSTSTKWTAPRPINVYVIEHEEGLVLFDTGQDRRSVTDPDYFPKGFAGHIYARLAKFDVPPEDTLSEGLRGLGYGSRTCASRCSRTCTKTTSAACRSWPRPRSW